jgi:ubiquinone/menaquinone biosynthesis C-methylase UbiE
VNIETVFGKQAKTYGLKYSIQEEIREEALKLCKNLKGNLLDLGCGNGLFLEKISKYNDHITAVDFSEDMIKEAQKRAGKHVKFFKKDICKTDLADSSFDTIVFTNILMHLENKDNSYLKEINRIMKDDGLLILEFRNKNSFFIKKSQCSVNGNDINKDIIFNSYSMNEIKKKLKNHDLYIEKIIPVTHKIMKDKNDKGIHKLFRKICFFAFRTLTKNRLLAPNLIILVKKWKNTN